MVFVEAPFRAAGFQIGKVPGKTGCGKTLQTCHSERSEESGPEHFQADMQGAILRCAQDDNCGGFFRSLQSRPLRKTVAGKTEKPLLGRG
jgi:hypothetical protein